MKHQVNILEYDSKKGISLKNSFFFESEEHAVQFGTNYNAEQNKYRTPDYFTYAEYIQIKEQESIEQMYYNTQELQKIEFICSKNNYGQQVLVFGNDEINVILRNQNKNIREHNSLEKQDIKYRITIERL